MSTISKVYRILALTVTVTATAQNPDQSSVRVAVCSENPAAAIFRDVDGASRGYVSFTDADYGNASTVQDGTGRSMLTIGAESWMPLDTLQAVWGDASFSSGHRNDVRWTNAVDMHRVGPYVIGDADGGNLSTQIYDFGGGYARHLGRRLTLGISLGYRAEIDYRQRDPRLRAIVSDLDISVGAAYAIGHGMQIGLSASYNLYNQDDDVDYYSVDNNARLYPLTGLGTTYSRFSGIAGDFSTGYDGHGWGASVSLLPTDPAADCLSVLFGVNNDVSKLILRGYNNLNLTKLDRDRYRVGVARPISIGAVRLIPELQVEYDQAKGTENLFGTAVGNVYEKIGSRQSYDHSVLDGNVRVGVCWNLSDRTSLGMIPAVGYINDVEKMTTADRELSYSVIMPSVDFSWHQRWDRLWRTSVNAGFMCGMASAGTERLPGINLNEPIDRMVLDDFAFRTSDTNSYRGSVAVSRTLKDKISLELSVGYALTTVANHDNRRQLYSSLSINF